jgi:phytoene dehydrogenase-like protein
MTADQRVDAVVVGSGPNGFAAAITLAQAGLKVTLLEGAPTLGGGVRSGERTLPGFVHDICSAVHPFGRASPFFSALGLERRGLRWIDPPLAIAHPLDDGTAAVIARDVDGTAAGLGQDADAYRRLMGPLVRDWDHVMPNVLAPFRVPLNPMQALRMARFGMLALQPATALARRFRGEHARALIGGCAAHSFLRLDERVSGAAALVMLASAHANGWPFPEGGAQRISDALAEELRALGGRIETSRPVARLEDLPDHRIALFDVAPRNLLAIAGERLSQRYRHVIERFRLGPAVFKLDAALDGPIPWRAPQVAQAGTVHIGGRFEDIAASEAEVNAGRVPERPFVLVAQQSLFDPTRAPHARHTLWAYCHIPNGTTTDMTDAILRQIERFAPGVRDRILKITSTGPAELEAYNPNNVRGDIAGGRQDLRQLFTRPTRRIFDPYATSDPALFLCSSSTPPGGGVHGMCGYYAARSALRRLR